MKYERPIPYILIAIAAFWIWNNSKCSGSSKPKSTVQTERIVKQFDTITVFEALPSKTKCVYVTKRDTFETENPLNEYYFNKWKEAEGNLQKQDSLFYDAIAEREYNTPFEDSLVKINVYSKVQGNLLAQSPQYTLKPRTINVKQTYFRLLIGPKISMQYETPYEASFGFNIAAQNAKGHIYDVGIDSRKNITAGVKFSVLNLKR